MQHEHSLARNCVMGQAWIACWRDWVQRSKVAVSKELGVYKEWKESNQQI